MRLIIIPFLLFTATAFGQLTEQGKYNWHFVLKKVKKSKGSTIGTRKIISEISAQYHPAEEQKELIEFYRNAYDFKIVDKSVLKSLIDSLTTHGLNEEIRHSAIKARNSIEFRLLNKKISDFNFPDKTGKNISLYSLTDKTVIVELWASWCGPCVREMANIPELRKANPHIEFYSISLDKTMEKMKKIYRRSRL